MAAGDAHFSPMHSRDTVAASVPGSTDEHRTLLERYFRYVRTLVPVVCLVVLVIVEVFSDLDPPGALLGWILISYVAGVAWQALVVGTRLPHSLLLRASLYVDTVLIACMTATLPGPEHANAAYLWPVLIASCLLDRRDVVAVTGLAATSAALVPWQTGSDASVAEYWSGPIMLVVIGAILAAATNRARMTERELQSERDLEDMVLRFTTGASGATTLDQSLRELELDIRTTFGVSHAWVDVAGVDRPRRALPGTTTVPVAWNGDQVARISVANAGAHPVQAELVRRLERLATFVGAVIGQSDALHRHEAASARLQEADRLKDKFLAMASHELRTPLTSIRGFSETMSRQWEILADEDKLRFLSIVVAQSERLTHLVDDVMLLSGIQSGRFELRPIPVRVEHAVERAVRELEADTDVDIAYGPDVRVHVDPDHLQHILGNYLDNAVQHGAAPITVSWDTCGSDVLITVADRGAGVSDELLPRLFGEFQRDRGQVISLGPGLGLSIARTLARAHGGDAWYEPNAPTGSRFLVRLPTMPS